VTQPYPISAPMAPRPEPVLFEAVCTPPTGLGRRGMLVVAGFVLGFSALVGLVFTIMGAWPVLGFAGLEAMLFLGLLLLHRRWARRSMEVLQLAEGRLTIRRMTWRGQREELVLDAYWTRLSLETRPGRVSALMLHHRRRAIEIGALLGEDQKRDLAAALSDALRRYREPVFDNPQLRDG